MVDGLAGCTFCVDTTHGEGTNPSTMARPAMQGNLGHPMQPPPYTPPTVQNWPLTCHATNPLIYPVSPHCHCLEPCHCLGKCQAWFPLPHIPFLDPPPPPPLICFPASVQQCSPYRKGSSTSLATSFTVQYVATVTTVSTTASGVLGTYAMISSGSVRVNNTSITSTN